MPKRKKSVRKIPAVPTVPTVPAAPPEVPAEPYMPGKPQHIVEPHELSPELLQTLPDTGSEGATQTGPVIESSKAPDVRKKVQQTGPYFMGGAVPYTIPPINYARSPVYFMQPDYRTLPYPYVPRRHIYVPGYPWYGY